MNKFQTVGPFLKKKWWQYPHVLSEETLDDMKVHSIASHKNF